MPEPAAVLEPEPPRKMVVNPEFAAKFEVLFKSGEQAIAITRCNELYRARAVVTKLMHDIGYPTIYWDPVRGFTWSENNDFALALKMDESSRPPKVLNKEYTDLVMAMDAVPRISPAMLASRGTLGDNPKGHAAVVMTDTHDQFKDKQAARTKFKFMVDECHISNGECKRPLVILVQDEMIHPELRGYVCTLDFPLPNETEILDIVDYCELHSRDKDNKQAICPKDLKNQLAATGLGLRAIDIESAISQGIATHKAFTKDMIATVQEKKKDLLAQEGALQYIPDCDMPGRHDIGGFEQAEEFVEVLAQAYLPGVRLDKPRGILTLGLPGTGKTMYAKLVARILEDVTGYVFTPVFLNIPALFGGLVGQTEGNIRRVLKILKTFGRYVLLMDELEKMIGGVKGSNDSGVSLRAVGMLLQWLSERVNDKMDLGFVVGTMNSVEGIDPEFFRRFNATFYTDLPTDKTRDEIMKIHFRKREIPFESLLDAQGNPVVASDWATVIAGTEHFIGSELEDVVTMSMSLARQSRQTDTPTIDDIEKAVGLKKPSIIWTTHNEKITAVREFCTNRALPVHLATEDDKPVPRTSGGSRRRSRDITS